MELRRQSAGQDQPRAPVDAQSGGLRRYIKSPGGRGGPRLPFAGLDGEGCALRLSLVGMGANLLIDVDNVVAVRSVSLMAED